MSGSGNLHVGCCEKVLHFLDRELKVMLNPDLPFLAFLDFLAFFVARNFLAFLSVFPFFPRDFRGSAQRKILAFWVVFLAFFQQSKERKIREMLQYLCRLLTLGRPRNHVRTKFSECWCLKFMGELPKPKSGTVGLPGHTSFLSSGAQEDSHGQRFTGTLS